MLEKLSTHNSLVLRKNKTKEVIVMANNNSNSKTQFENMKYEIAKEVGVNLKQGYNGDLTSREAGKIGGNIVKKVFQSYTGNSYPSERLGDTSR